MSPSIVLCFLRRIMRRQLHKAFGPGAGSRVGDEADEALLSSAGVSGWLACNVTFQRLARCRNVSYPGFQRNALPSISLLIPEQLTRTPR